MRGNIWIRNALFEFAPTIAFFTASRYVGFFDAVMVLIVATFVSVGLAWWSERRVPYFALVSAVAIGLFGGASVLFDNADFFIISDTIIDGLFGVILLWSLRWQQPLLQRLFSTTFALTDRAWRILTRRWGLLFIVLAAINEMIRLTMTPEIWTYYKVSTIFIIVGFGCYQFTLSVKERIVEESNWLGLRTKDTV